MRCARLVPGGSGAVAQQYRIADHDRRYAAEPAPDMTRWLMSPQSIVPGNTMADMGLGQRDAADVAAYLDTLR